MKASALWPRLTVTATAGAATVVMKQPATTQILSLIITETPV